jgi:hypothetical protein
MPPAQPVQDAPSRAGDGIDANLGADSDQALPTIKKKRRRRARKSNADQDNLAGESKKAPSVTNDLNNSNDSSNSVRPADNSHPMMEHHGKPPLQSEEPPLHANTAAPSQSLPYKPAPKVIGLPVNGRPNVIEAEPDLPQLPVRPKSPVEDHFSHGDTIYIDQEGNIEFAGNDEDDKKSEELRPDTGVKPLEAAKDTAAQNAG